MVWMLVNRILWSYQGGTDLIPPAGKCGTIEGHGANGWGSIFFEQDVPEATTLLHFRHLLEEHGIGKPIFDAINRCLERTERMMRGAALSIRRRSRPPMSMMSPWRQSCCGRVTRSSAETAHTWNWKNGMRSNMLHSLPPSNIISTAGYRYSLPARS